MYQFLQLIQTLAIKLIQLIQPILVPLCFIIGWGVIILAVWNVVAAMRDGVARAQKMHQIPCADCQYFTNNHLLKCPLHPKEALSEMAIGCPDYESTALSASLNRNP